MIVKAIWEFDADVEDFDPEFVDIYGLAKSSAKRDLADCLERNILCADDFEYVIESESKGE